MRSDEERNKEIEKLRAEVLSLTSTLEFKNEKIKNLEDKVLRLTNLHEKSYKYCEQLRSQVDDLTEKLQNQNGPPDKIDVGVQVDLLAELKNDEKKDWNTGETEEPIAEMVKSAAAEALNMQGYTYDEASNYYYHHSTGYYYSFESGLYYDPKTGIYFYYNPQTEKYEFHSQVSVDDPSKSKLSSHVKKLKRKKIKADISDDESSLEEGELSDDSSCSSDCDQMQCDLHQESAKAWPPCLRLMVTDSQIESIGSLYIITHPGGWIGSSPECSVQLSAEHIQDFHVQFKFNDQSECYEIQSSHNNAHFNHKPLYNSETTESEKNWHEVHHLSIVKIGETSLTIHVHGGSETCDKCEPGIVMAQASNQTSQSQCIEFKTANDKEVERRRQLKKIKKKYGLKNADYVQHESLKNMEKKGYKDKAEERRQTKGSDNPYEKTAQPTSLEMPIDANNKGFKMLQGMGWKSGQSLGKSAQDGIKEPVNVDLRAGREGLGIASGTVPVPTEPSSKSKLWLKTSERYNKIQN